MTHECRLSAPDAMDVYAHWRRRHRILLTAAIIFAIVIWAVSK